METNIQPPRLSETLAAFRDSYFGDASRGGVKVDAERCRALGRIFDQLVDQAQGLERKERTLIEMEAMARDLDPVAAAGVLDMRKGVIQAACSVEGTNVVLFPLVPRSREIGGAA